MPSVENKTFGEIIVGDSASTERTLQAGDVRAWAAAFGEAGALAGPGESQAAAGIVTGILTALVGSALPGPGSSIRSASVQIKGALPIATVMTAWLVVREKRPDQGVVVLDGQCTDPTGRVVATAILEVLARHGAAATRCRRASARWAERALLLRSANDKHPNGLANSSDVVGRHYMRHNNSAFMAISKNPNPTVFQKTLGLNDFYFRSEDWEYPMGCIQMLGKTDGEMLKGEAPDWAIWKPEFALDYMAFRTLH